MSEKNIPTSIGTAIAQARAQLGLTQREFAESIGVSQGLVGAWESHIKTPGAKTLKKISDATGISMDAIAGGDDVSSALQVTDRTEIRVVLLYRRLPALAKNNVLQMMEMAANLTRVSQKKSSPLEVE